MRIIAGTHRGLRLAELGKADPAAHLRPTTDRIRESLFNVLAQYGHPQGKALDLFAGTGALGLEALSRGAQQVCFVENGRVGARLIRDNIARARRAADTQLLSCDATRLPPGTPHELVFLDPPYGKSLGGKALSSAQAQGWLAPQALIVWEESTPQSHPGLAPVDQRRYGDTHITLLRAP